MVDKATPLPPASLTPRRRLSPNGSNASAQKAWMDCMTAPQDLFPDSQTPQATCDAIEVLRRARHTGKQIAAEVGVPPATVCRVLKRRDTLPADRINPTKVRADKA